MAVLALRKSFLTKENFFELFEKLEKEQFTVKKSPITYQGLLDLGISEDWLKKRKYKRQRIYSRIVNRKKVFVLTTYSEELGGAVPDACGWVLIKDLLMSSVIFSFEIRRSSKKFFDNLLAQAIAHVEFAERWPNCQFCNIAMVPTKIDEAVMHERQFICRQTRCIGFSQPTNIFITTVKLSEKNSEVFLAGYKRYQEYVEQNRLKGKETFPRRKQRYRSKHGESPPVKKIDLYEGIDPPHDDSGLYSNG